ncbi:hypothetical protein MOV98_17380 (plasmid) [Acinetobacter variabilis]|nr:hypothetical protein MOV98_17380 [Acinetobacter variabilis]
MSKLYNIEVTQGTSQPVIEPDVYNEETLLFYLNRFEVEENSHDYKRLMNGERLLITTYKNEPLSIKLIEYYELSAAQVQIVRTLKICAGILVVVALILVSILDNFKLLIILIPNALLLWFTSKKLEITSSEKFEEVAKRVLIMLGISMLLFSIVAFFIV